MLYPSAEEGGAVECISVDCWEQSSCMQRMILSHTFGPALPQTMGTVVQSMIVHGSEVYVVQ